MNPLLAGALGFLAGSLFGLLAAGLAVGLSRASRAEELEEDRRLEAERSAFLRDVSRFN